MTDPSSTRSSDLPARRAEYRKAVNDLKDAQKSSRGAPAYSRFVNRPLGRYLAAGAHVLGLTPNMVTALSGACSFIGIFVLAWGPLAWWIGFGVSMLLVLGYALDAADGQLARLRGGGSLSGEWLDHMVDSAKISSLHAAVLIMAYRSEALDVGWLLVPVTFGVVANVTFFGMILNGLLRDRHSARTGTPIVRGPSSTFRSLIVLPTDYGLMCLIFVTLGSLPIFFVLYGAIFVFSALFLCAAAFKWFRDMESLSA